MLCSIPDVYAVNNVHRVHTVYNVGGVCYFRIRKLCTPCILYAFTVHSVYILYIAHKVDTIDNVMLYGEHTVFNVCNACFVQTELDVYIAHMFLRDYTPIIWAFVFVSV